MGKLLTGSDPELFFKRPDGRIMTACGLVGGTKEEPIPYPYGAIQEDGAAAEFNTKPASTLEEFLLYNTSMYKVIEGIAKGAGLEVAHRASARFPMFLLNEHPQCMVSGCAVDYNAYTGEPNPNPDVHDNLRTAAGHIHLGYDEDLEYKHLVSYLDWRVGCWSVIKDDDTTRREKYGKAGAFRPKPYGLEYRVPSNFWLRTEGLMRGIYHHTTQAYELALANARKPDDNEIIEAINTHDKHKCAELLRMAA